LARPVVAAVVVVLAHRVVVAPVQAREPVVLLLRALPAPVAQVRVLAPVLAREQVVRAVVLPAVRRAVASSAADLPPRSPPSFSAATARNSPSAARARCVPVPRSG
jgi:hypothetical protein